MVVFLWLLFLFAVSWVDGVPVAPLRRWSLQAPMKLASGTLVDGDPVASFTLGSLLYLIRWLSCGFVCSIRPRREPTFDGFAVVFHPDSHQLLRSRGFLSSSRISELLLFLQSEKATLESRWQNGREQSFYFLPLSHDDTIYTTRDYYKFCFLPRYIVHWNFLPSPLVNIESLASLNPFLPKSDQHHISPYSINT